MQIDIEAPVLTGRWVQLEPLRELHRQPLRAAADDERIWTHTLIIARGPEFDRWFDDARANQSAGRQHPFAVRWLEDQAIVGATSFLDIVPRHRRLEIGWTWYRPDVWGSRVNPECKLLMLTHAFERLGMNRVALCTDIRNVRSQAAIEKLEAVKEGVLRAHMIAQGGRLRDSVLYSIVAGDWPRVKALLQARLDTPRQIPTRTVGDSAANDLR
jgi:N-acetyltransferase